MNIKEEIQFFIKAIQEISEGNFMIISVIGSGGKTTKIKAVKRSIFKRR